METRKNDVNNPAASQGGQTVDIELTREERQVIELLRTHKLSIKHLDEERRQMIRQFIEHLHHEKGISLTDMAKLVGNKTSGYMSWLARQLGIQPRDFEEARLAGIHTKVRKYERKPFDGTDEDKAYLLAFRHGDLSASVPFATAIRISMSTTHPAQADLFTSLFSPYGHVYKHPRYKKDTKTYEWNFSTILHESFGFLLDTRDKHREWIAADDSRALSYVAGLIDAEGNVGVYPNARTTAITISIWNTDTELLEFCHRCLSQLGLKPLAPYLNKEVGTVTSKYHIVRRKDYYRVMIATFENSQSLIRRISLRHQEKLERSELALSIAKGELWENVKSRVQKLQDKFKQRRIQFVKEAEQEFLKKHPVNVTPPSFFPLQRPGFGSGMSSNENNANQESRHPQLLGQLSCPWALTFVAQSYLVDALIRKRLISRGVTIA